jgi:long-chain acyl-CoA synthetase
MERRSLADYLPDFLRHGEQHAFVQPSGYRTVRWTYRQVAETAFRFARELDNRSIGKGERVLLWGPNSAEWVAAFLGCALRGAVAVPMDDVAAPEFATRVYAQTAARLLVGSREHASTWTSALVLEDLREVLAKHSAAPVSGIEIDSSDPLEIIFTSGTTADPRGVVITHGNVLANIAPLESEIGKYLKYERFVHPVRFLNLLPLSHVFGQFLGIFLPQLLAGTVIFHDTLKPASIVGVIRRDKVSVLVTVPRFLQSLKEKIELDLESEGVRRRFRSRFDFAKGKHFLRRWWIFRAIRRQFGWKFLAVISGGAALDSQTEEFWDRLGYAVIQGYGLTETTSLVSVNHPFRLGKGSIGKVLAGREVKLAADGEILVRGGGVASTYWTGNGPQAIAGDEGWYRTGDIGELDRDGNLYFKGRKKEVIVTPAGMNIYPEDLEAALRLQPGVKDAIVVGLERDGNAEPCAVVIPRNGAETVDALVQRANASLAEYQRMHRWMVWPEDDFPRTPTQKARRNVIQRAVEEKLSGRKTNTSSLGELIQRVTGRNSLLPSADAHLESDLNLSSLDRVALLSALEDRYQVDLSETRFAAVNTVGDLERILRGDLPQRAVYHYPRWTLRWPVTWIRLAVHYLLLRPAVFLLGWPRVIGRENLRNVSGPVLVICNHIGDVDPGFVLTALPARFRHRLAVATGGEALEILRTPPSDRPILARVYDRMRWFLGVSLLNLFPLPREAGFRDSFAHAGHCVDLGYSVLIFPEGHHTLDGKLRPFRAGIGLMANNLRLPIIPVCISGLYEIKKAGKKFAWPGQITVSVGAPVQFPADYDPQTIAHDLHARVAELAKKAQSQASKAV